jgi:hypothetical protein
MPENKFPLVPIIDECQFGHKFAKLFGHHPMRNGSPRCPHCLAEGRDMFREQLENAWLVIEKAESWGEAGIETMDSETAREYEEQKQKAGYIP